MQRLRWQRKKYSRNKSEFSIAFCSKQKNWKIHATTTTVTANLTRTQAVVFNNFIYNFHYNQSEERKKRSDKIGNCKSFGLFLFLFCTCFSRAHACVSVFCVFAVQVNRIWIIIKQSFDLYKKPAENFFLLNEINAISSSSFNHFSILRFFALRLMTTELI